MHIICAGLNHKTAPIDIRETCAFSRLRQLEIYKQLKKCSVIEGAVLLITCNRTEVYAAVRETAAGFEALELLLQNYSGIDRTGFAQYVYQLSRVQAVSHLFAVAAGLDSMILGEQQILGQVKDAFCAADSSRASCSVLNLLFQSALHAGKRVRSRTGIGRFPVSISSAAVELCREIFGDLTGKRVLVAGAGDTGELAVKHLVSNGVQSVIVANRTFDHAEQMAREVGGRAVHFDRLADEIGQADIVISCTAAPHFVLREDNCGRMLHTRAGGDVFVLIDLAVPRDIEPGLGRFENVYLYDVDDLQNVVEKNYKERLRSAHQARSIIEEETGRFTAKIAQLPLSPVISDLKRHAESIRQCELEKAFGKLGALSPREKDIVNSLTGSIVNKLLHNPIVQLKEKSALNQGSMYADLLRELFGLEEKVPEESISDKTDTSTGG